MPHYHFHFFQITEDMTSESSIHEEGLHWLGQAMTAVPGTGGAVAGDPSGGLENEVGPG